MPVAPLTTVKAAVDLELPTPLQTWVMLDHDQMRHHPHESAEFRPTFNGQDYLFYSGCERDGVGLAWHVSQADGPNTSRGRQGIVTDVATWALAKAAFATRWEAICEAERDREAVRRYSGDVIDEPERAQDARVSAIPLFTGTWVLDPVFDEDIYDYDVTATSDSLGIQPTKKFPGQMIHAFDGSIAYPGGLSVTAPSGDSVVTVILTITAEDGVHQAVYTLTIRR